MSFAISDSSLSAEGISKAVPPPAGSFTRSKENSSPWQSSAIASFNTSLFARAAKPSFTAISVFFLSDMIHVLL
jgi:hypothetical protein